ncbi:hypothetical protein TNIN_71101 [Trichonephila inaurata madagascariensis]|uniref:Uncharacterized protein n=1 Tax=Trichonephila inaurata madagascariensis TaxID=2747483 RepID=A0A8X6YIB6_9ARAC|nr:hypothetical protein TNIN_71101 [Trichonephila inaurata madagascariensis]
MNSFHRKQNVILYFSALLHAKFMIKDVAVLAEGLLKVRWDFLSFEGKSDPEFVSNGLQQVISKSIRSNDLEIPVGTRGLFRGLQFKGMQFFSFLLQNARK